MSQGIWNKTFFSKEEIQKAYENTDWTMRENRNLFLDHEDKKASEWIGEVDNVHFSGETLYGDLMISDPVWAPKMKFGKPKFGISPKVIGQFNDEDKSLKNFKYGNFSLVVNPAVKTAFINNMDQLEVKDMSITLDSHGISDETMPPKMEPNMPQDKEKMKADMMAMMNKIMEGMKMMSEQESKKVNIEVSNDFMDNKRGESMGLDNLKNEMDVESLSDLFELFELKGLRVADVMNKARELRQENESWRAALKRASMTFSATKAPVVEPVKEVVPVADAKKELGDSVKNPLETKLKEMESVVKILNDKLDEPNRTVFGKKETVKLSIEELDKGMIKYLQDFEKEVSSNGGN